jgi:uncharacterized protein YjdB
MNNRFFGIIFGVLFLLVMAGCGGGGGGGAAPAAVSLVSIEVSPVNPSIAVGTTQQFKATGIYSDNSKQDLTTQVTWSSSDVAVASISNTAGSNGLATAIKVGSTTITATLGGISGTTTLTVTHCLI